MRNLLVSLVVLIFVPLVGNSQTIPAKVEKYLRANYPNWVIAESWRADSPRLKAITRGDLNGDGKTDYAVLIRKNDRLYALALLELKNGFKAYNLLAQSGDYRWIAGIDLIGKGEKVFLGENESSNRSFRLKTDAVNVYDGEGMGMVFYWQNGRFLSGQNF
jgi:hypothetical protein